MRKIDGDALEERLKSIHGFRAPGVASGYEIGVQDGLQAAYGAVMEAPTVADWISVTDRLPERGGRYLCYAGDHPLGGFSYIANYNPDMRKFWSYERNVSLSFITDWMPLPEPPEEMQE